MTQSTLNVNMFIYLFHDKYYQNRSFCCFKTFLLRLNINICLKANPNELLVGHDIVEVVNILYKELWVFLSFLLMNLHRIIKISKVINTYYPLFKDRKKRILSHFTCLLYQIQISIVELGSIGFKIL